jgi:hypothetical protein
MRLLLWLETPAQGEGAGPETTQPHMEDAMSKSKQTLGQVLERYAEEYNGDPALVSAVAKLPAPQWTGSPTTDTKALHSTVRSIGRAVGASPERVEAVLHLADAILEGSGDNQSQFTFGVTGGILAQFDQSLSGTDDEYLFMQDMAQDMEEDMDLIGGGDGFDEEDDRL